MMTQEDRDRDDDRPEFPSDRTSEEPGDLDGDTAPVEPERLIVALLAEAGKLCDDATLAAPGAGLEAPPLTR